MKVQQEIQVYRVHQGLQDPRVSRVIVVSWAHRERPVHRAHLDPQVRQEREG